MTLLTKKGTDRVTLRSIPLFDLPRSFDEPLLTRHAVMLRQGRERNGQFFRCILPGILAEALERVGALNCDVLGSVFTTID